MRASATVYCPVIEGGHGSGARRREAVICLPALASQCDGVTSLAKESPNRRAAEGGRVRMLALLWKVDT